MAVDAAADLHQATGAEEVRRARHHDVGPAALVGALLEHGNEGGVQWARLRCGIHDRSSTISKPLPSGSRAWNIGGTPGQRSTSPTSTPCPASAAWLAAASRVVKRTPVGTPAGSPDRKSTRLNSSH